MVFAVPALNWIIVNHSWHHAFGALGVVGLMWVVAWFLLGREGPLVQTVATAADTRIPYSRLLTSRTFIGCVVATFGAYWALSLGLTWFTPFIVKGLGFTQQQAGFISIMPWVFGACIVLLTGWLSQRLMAGGMTTRGARGNGNAVTFAFALRRVRGSRCGSDTNVQGTSRGHSSVHARRADVVVVQHVAGRIHSS